MTGEPTITLAVDATDRTGIVASLQTVINVCDTGTGNLPARTGVFRRLLPDYSGADPITELEVRLAHDRRVLTTHTRRATRSLRLLANGITTFTRAQAIDLAGALTTANLIIAERGGFPGRNVEDVTTMRDATTAPDTARASKRWLTNYDVVADLMSFINDG